MSAKHPRHATLERLGFIESEITGVYRNENVLAKEVHLISLNRLPDTTYNAYFKLLASRKQTQERAVSLLQEAGWQHLPIELTLFLATLWRYVFGAKDDEPMIKQMTTEQMIKEGEVWMDFLLQSMSPGQLLAKVDTKKLLEEIPIEERLSGIPTEERLSGIPTEERLSGIPTEERLSGIPTEERLSGIPTEERLSGISAEELEAFLNKLREQEDSAENDK